mmetsp:Transcript_1993/g.4629  ORF Transcript_1993/g.4629 Transcript_1993/m.4629 type:complete len:204 (+) Transcript_1993:614-1225(+)
MRRSCLRFFRCRLAAASTPAPSLGRSAGITSPPMRASMRPADFVVRASNPAAAAARAWATAAASDPTVSTAPCARSTSDAHSARSSPSRLGSAKPGRSAFLCASRVAANPAAAGANAAPAVAADDRRRSRAWRSVKSIADSAALPTMSPRHSTCRRSSAAASRMCFSAPCWSSVTMASLAAASSARVGGIFPGRVMLPTSFSA